MKGLRLQPAQQACDHTITVQSSLLTASPTSIVQSSSFIASPSVTVQSSILHSYHTIIVRLSILTASPTVDVQSSIFIASPTITVQSSILTASPTVPVQKPIPNISPTVPVFRLTSWTWPWGLLLLLLWGSSRVERLSGCRRSGGDTRTGCREEPRWGGLVILGLKLFPHQVMVAAGLAMVLSLGLGLTYLTLSMITLGKPLIGGVNITKF